MMKAMLLICKSYGFDRRNLCFCSNSRSQARSRWLQTRRRVPVFMSSNLLRGSHSPHFIHCIVSSISYSSQSRVFCTALEISQFDLSAA